MVVTFAHSCQKSPGVLIIIPQCTDNYPPVYSWYPSSVLNTSWCTLWYPPVYWISSSVLNIPSILMISPVYWTPHCIHYISHTHQCTHNILLVCWTPPCVLKVSPTVLMRSLQCTEHLLVYSRYPTTVLMMSPSVLNMPQCTAHPLVYCTDIMQGGFCSVRPLKNDSFFFVHIALSQPILKIMS